MFVGKVAKNFCVVSWLCLHFSCGGFTPAEPPAFNGEHAFEYLVKQCEFGPRVPGTQAHRECLQFLSAELRKFGAVVTPQSFKENLPGFDSEITLTNIVASFGVQKTQRVLLCAHWDSRPWADQDPLAQNQDQPVPGANDGASGVAVLLEVARNIQQREPNYGVDIVLFDGEDSGLPGRSDSYALGAQYFAKTRAPGYRPQFGILLDMIGDKDLQIYQEGNSLRYAPRIVEKVWSRSQTLGLSGFSPSPGYQITDDHLPLLNVGIPCVDVIDFDYEYWHTLADTPDKCSPESLAQVGRLVLSLLYEE